MPEFHFGGLLLFLFFLGLGVGLLVGWCIWRLPSLVYSDEWRGG